MNEEQKTSFLNYAMEISKCNKITKDVGRYLISKGNQYPSLEVYFSSKEGPQSRFGVFVSGVLHSNKSGNYYRDKMCEFLKNLDMEEMVMLYTENSTCFIPPKEK